MKCMHFLPTKSAPLPLFFVSVNGTKSQNNAQLFSKEFYQWMEVWPLMLHYLFYFTTNLALNPRYFFQHVYTIHQFIFIFITIILVLSSLLLSRTLKNCSVIWHLLTNFSPVFTPWSETLVEAHMWAQDLPAYNCEWNSTAFGVKTK